MQCTLSSCAGGTGRDTSRLRRASAVSADAPVGGGGGNHQRAASSQPSFRAHGRAALVLGVRSRGRTIEARRGEKNNMPQDIRFPRLVNAELFRARALGQGANLHVRDDDNKWHQALAPLDGHVVGLICVRLLHRFDALAVLSPLQRCLYEYWITTRYPEENLVFLETLAGARFEQPVPVRNNDNMVKPKGLFSNAHFSAARCMQAALMGQQGIAAQLIEQWRVRRPQLVLEPAPHSLCWTMPAGHALLCVLRAWPTYAFPAILGRQARGTGMRHVSRLLAPALPTEQTHQQQHPVLEDLGPQELQHTTDFIRRQVAGADASVCAEAVGLVAYLQSIIDTKRLPAVLQEGL